MFTKAAPLAGYGRVNRVPLYAQVEGHQDRRRIVPTVSLLSLANGQDQSE